MKSALLTKAALCICPPALIATSVATIPPVRKAVHHAIASHESARPAPAAIAPCPPVVAYQAIVPPVPVVPTEQGPLAFAAVAPGGTAPGGTTIGPQFVSQVPTNLGPGLIPGGNTPVPPLPAVPEPKVWLTMLAGFGFIGAALRSGTRRAALASAFAGSIALPGRRRRRRGIMASLIAGFAGSGNSLSGGMASAEAGPTLAKAGAHAGAQAGAQVGKAALLAKAAMCVCPPVAMMVGATSIPVVRHAVYAATAPALPGSAAPGMIAPVAPPCVPTAAPAVAAVSTLAAGQLAMLPETASWPG